MYRYTAYLVTHNHTEIIFSVIALSYERVMAHAKARLENYLVQYGVARNTGYLISIESKWTDGWHEAIRLEATKKKNRITYKDITDRYE